MGREGGNDSDKRRVSSPQVFFFFFSLHYCTLLQKIIINILPYKSRGLGQAKPGPSRIWRLWLGLGFEKAKAGWGQAKAGAFRPSRARQITSLSRSEPLTEDLLDTYPGCEYPVFDQVRTTDRRLAEHPSRLWVALQCFSKWEPLTGDDLNTHSGCESFFSFSADQNR